MFGLNTVDNWLQKLAKEVLKNYNALVLTAANAKAALERLLGHTCSDWTGSGCQAPQNRSLTEQCC